jgi:hypothetical protein
MIFFSQQRHALNAEKLGGNAGGSWIDQKSF